LVSASVGTRNVGGVDAVVGDVDLGRVGVEDADQLVAGRLRRHDHPGRPAQGGPRRGAEERPLDAGVDLGLREPRRVVDRYNDRPADTQRKRVVRRVQDVGLDLLRDQRQAGLLPGEPGRAVGDRSGPATMRADGAIRP
jgi:hypothetical protein